MRIPLLFLLIYCLIPIAATAESTFPRQITSDSGRYTVELEQMMSEIPLREIHSWTVRFERKSKTKSKPLRIEIDGGMPRHGHGLPTEPKLARYLGDERYQIDGVLFNMPGLWQLQFRVLDEKGWDQVIFKLAVRNEVKQTGSEWSQGELGVIKGLMLKETPKSSDLGNAYFNDTNAIELGKLLFFDADLSPAKVACSQCHQPQNNYADSRVQSIGVQPLQRNAPSLIGVANADWFYWDGRRDSLWSQALVPFEAKAEMASSRVFVLQQVMAKPLYRDLYTEIFGNLPDTLWLQGLDSTASPISTGTARASWKALKRAERNNVNRHYSNIGKAIAAFEGSLQFTPSRFDDYAQQLLNKNETAARPLLTADERAGLRWFISGKTQCLNCHNGPQFSNQGFHNIGTGIDTSGKMDYGRALGIQDVKLNEFNCASRYADGHKKSCEKLDYINATEISGLLNGAFKVPSLRNVSKTSPYMHDGRFDSLEAVMEHYRNPPDKTSRSNSHELSALDRLDDDATGQLILFLKTLDSPVKEP